MKRIMLVGIILIFSMSINFAGCSPMLNRPIKSITKKLIKVLEYRSEEVIFLTTLSSNNLREKSTLSQYITDRLRTELANHRIRVVSREALETVLNENRLAYSGVLDETTVVKLGKALGSSIAIMGNVVESRTEVHVNLHINDLKKSYTIGGVVYSFRKNTEFRKVVETFPDSL